MVPEQVVTNKKKRAKGKTESHDAGFKSWISYEYMFVYVCNYITFILVINETIIED